MRLVTYDRAGARRLGAWVGSAVVDLADAVGHPAFPSTMEHLVRRHGGTIIDAARDALAHPEVVREFEVRMPLLLVPFVPQRRGPWALLGPGEDVVWPDPRDPLHCQAELACITGDVASPSGEGAPAIFGYALLARWLCGYRGGPGEVRRQVAASLGPWVLTAEDFQDSGAVLTVRVDGEERSRAHLDGARGALEAALQSRRSDRPTAGELLTSGAFPDTHDGESPVLSPGSLVEVEGSGLGVLRARLSGA